MVAGDPVYSAHYTLISIQPNHSVYCCSCCVQRCNVSLNAFSSHATVLQHCDCYSIEVLLCYCFLGLLALAVCVLFVQLCSLCVLLLLYYHQLRCWIASLVLAMFLQVIITHFALAKRTFSKLPKSLERTATASITVVGVACATNLVQG